MYQFKGRIPTGDLILPCPRSTNPCYREITYTPATLGWWETPSTTQRCKGMPYTPWSLPPKTLGFQKTSKDPTRINIMLDWRLLQTDQGIWYYRIRAGLKAWSQVHMKHKDQRREKPLLTDPSFPKGCHNFLTNKNQEEHLGEPTRWE